MMRQPGRSRVAWVVIVTIAVTLLVAARNGRSGVELVRPDATRWTQQVARIDAALAAGSVQAANQAWYDAHTTALASGSWEAMLASGDASLRIGRAAATRETQARARQAYLLALFRARGQRSVEGVLQAVDAFARLGDDEPAAYGLEVARELLSRQPEPGPEARLHEVRAQLLARRLQANRRD